MHGAAGRPVRHRGAVQRVPARDSRGAREGHLLRYYLADADARAFDQLPFFSVVERLAGEKVKMAEELKKWQEEVEARDRARCACWRRPTRRRARA